MIQKFAIGKVTAAKDAASVTVSANSNVQKNTLLSQLRDQLKCASPCDPPRSATMIRIYCERYFYTCTPKLHATSPLPCLTRSS